ncbi:hypothetical protein [Oceanidesulfovibrio marinus]|uniref:Membrane domain of glycerophosphoryl diester phosphodiesterase n=1 Tax=Oceanidesulfovibrio marinus TaxID=370038 RepID=A0A6P1ZHK5_9BACT|nr:hypothetical protein [Oceanidesulfovibrio marinus]QJT07434.1 hypothetical protein E8L03_00230 [Oceanidesulfovibrio marinus]TVM34651.1 hypothetical protein DQK91_08760 [Oceanidesulfovibrio marinus]
MQYRVGEMGVGEVFDVSFNVFKDNYKPIATAAALTLLPYMLLVVVTTLGNFVPRIDQIPELHTPGTSTRVMIEAMAPTVLLSMVTAFLGYVNAVLMCGVLYIISASYYLDTPMRPLVAIRHTLSRWWPVLKTSLMVMLLMFGVMVLFGVAIFALNMLITRSVGNVLQAVIMAAVGVLFLVVMAFIYLRYLLGSNIVMLEGISGRKALSRSANLMRGVYWKGFVIVLILFIGGAVIGYGMSLIPYEPVALFVRLAVNINLYMFGAIVGTILYFSNRCKHENFDLVLLAEEAGE